MDPISIIGLTGSLVSIGEVITSSVKHLVELQSKYQNANLIVSLLIGQLTTIKAALKNLSEWMASSLDGIPGHEQLVDDLNISIGSCKTIISILDERINLLGGDCNKNLQAKGKIKFLYGEHHLTEFTNHLNNQINALNLLLTAIQCQNSFDRNKLLRGTESRHIIDKVQDDQSSLVESVKGRTSESLSRLDIEFDFDREIITTDLYRAALKSTLKRATSTVPHIAEPGPSSSEDPLEVRRDNRHPSISKSETTCEITRQDTSLSSTEHGKSYKFSTGSWSIHQHQPLNPIWSPTTLEKQSKKMKTFGGAHGKIYSIHPGDRFRLILYGSSGSGKSTLKRSIVSLCQGGLDVDERLSFKEGIIRSLLRSAKIVSGLMTEPKFPSDCNIGSLDAPFRGSRSDLGIFLQRLWQDEHFREALDKWTDTYKTSAQYFFNSIARICSSEYIPNEEDILRINSKSVGVDSTTLKCNDQIVDMYDIGGAREERKTWITHVDEGPTAIVLLVPMARFDCPADDSIDDIQLHESLKLFEEVIECRRPSNAKFVLLFTQVDILRDRIHTSAFAESMKAYFPDFAGDFRDLNQIMDCFRHRFLGRVEHLPSLVEIAVVFGSLVQPIASTTRYVLHLVSEHILHWKVPITGILVTTTTSITNHPMTMEQYAAFWSN